MTVVYVVVTEQWYGGELHIRVFSTLEDANSYKRYLEKSLQLDVLIIERDLQ